MGEVNLQVEGLESILSICMYCGTHRNDAGFWEQVYSFDGPVPESRINYGLFSEGRQNCFPDEYISPGEENRNTLKGKISPEKSDAYGWFLVNNKGCLFGDYDKGQRL